MASRSDVERALIEMLRKFTLLQDQRATRLMDGQPAAGVSESDLRAIVGPVVALLADP